VTNTVASARPYPGVCASGRSPHTANASENRLIVLPRSGSAPLSMTVTPDRSSVAFSASVTRLAVYS
jgi:hypothetical protein